MAGRPAGGTLRAWSVGCSTGEEAYSLAIALKEALDRIEPAAKFTLQIFATDLDRDAIDKARQGSYPANIAADVSAERLQRFFIKEETGYRVGKEIRETITFATQNLIMDPPFTKLDLLVCRNLLIYLTPELQKKLLPLFHCSLTAGGVLFLGSAETVSAFTDLFAPLSLKQRIFRRRESVLPHDKLMFPPSFVPAAPGTPKESPMLKPAANLQSRRRDSRGDYGSSLRSLFHHQGPGPGDRHRPLHVQGHHREKHGRHAYGAQYRGGAPSSGSRSDLESFKGSIGLAPHHFRR